MPVPAFIPPTTIDGQVVAIHSRWTADGSRIVTDATIRTVQGDEVVVSQLGGSVDGIGMITMPGPPMLREGMTVAVAVRRQLDLSSREHLTLDSVRVLAAPPSFVRTGPTKAGRSLYWEPTTIPVVIDAAGTTALAGDTEFPLIEESIETWNAETASCSYLKVETTRREPREVNGKDRIHLIKIRDDVWGRPAVGDDPARTYDSLAAGLTTVTFVDDARSDRDGAIVDADVELNGVNFAISNNGVSTKDGLTLSELKNTLTHEIGHLHGLEHPCLTSASEGPREDHAGNPVPLCDVVLMTPQRPEHQRILEATMFNYQEPGETKKETLSADDINAMCEIYPIGSEPGGCCSASGQSGNGRLAGTLLLVGATILTVLGRRKVR